MNPLAIIEYTMAFVLSFSIFGLFPWVRSKTSDKWPVICLILSIIWLTIDATLYVFLIYPEVPFFIRYLINLLSYSLGPAIFVIFIKYREQYIAERTSIKKWEYHVPMGILSFITIAIIFEFIRGNIIVFNNGLVEEDNGLPFYIHFLWLLVLLYLPLVALPKRKSIGLKSALLLGFVDFFLLISAIISIITDVDITVCFGALEIFFTITLLQRNKTEESNKAKTHFLFNMSHDIRTPMNAITGFTNMAIRHIDEKDKVLDYLSKVQQSGNILLSLINNVLEVSKIESGNVTLEEQPGDVYYSFVNIEETMKELADTKDIHISFQIDNIKDRYVYADYSRCLRIFINVITNAIKYTPANGTVKVSCTQLETQKEGYGTYQYIIEDNGIGMSEEFQKHIFEQFARENSATVSGIQGTGLGMSVVKSFVDIMSGTISIKSKKGEGSTFTIILPFRLQEGKNYVDPKTGKLISNVEDVVESEKYDFSGKRILLVEDNEFNREIAREILEESGFVIEEVDDGTKAVDKLKEKGCDYYDFILMDIQMPVMDGYEATKAIRKMYPDSKLPIIALSANAFEEDKAASLNAGMDAHVAKPIETKTLFSILAKYI